MIRISSLREQAKLSLTSFASSLFKAFKSEKPMAEEKKSAAKKADKKPEKKSTSSESTPKSKGEAPSRNGKGDGPRNIFSEEFRSNFDSIDWSK